MFHNNVKYNMDTAQPVLRADGTGIDIQQLDHDFGLWVHTGRNITISQCDNEYVHKKLTDKNVYPITEHIRGKAILISNTGYQALRLLKDLFIQMNYKIGIFTEKTSLEMHEIIQNEAKREENALVDSFVIVTYGTPEDFSLGPIIDALKTENAPNLHGKPKLVYVIGGGQIVRQVHELSNRYHDEDILIGATGFHGMMFFIYVFCTFVHELSAKDIWKLLMQFAGYHAFPASVYLTLTRDFFFFPNASKSVLPDDFASLNHEDIQLYMNLLREGEVNTYNIRLMMVGLFGAGKTSTARRLMGKEIDDVTSTDGIDVYIGRCRVDIDTNTWETIEDSKRSMPYVKLSEQLKQSGQNSTRKGQDHKAEEHMTIYKRRKYSGSQRLSSSSNPSFEMDAQSVYTRTSSAGRSDSFTDNDETMEQEDVSTKPDRESLKTAKRAIQEARTSADADSEAAIVSIWDFAGQFVYYATHQLFFSPRSIYLLVLNMEDDLERPVDEWYMDLNGKQSIETQGGVHFWLSSIYTYAKGQSKGVPPVILVGTHKDKIKAGDGEKERFARKYFQSMRDIFDNSPICDHIRMESVLLDNCIADPNIEQLKNLIMDVSKDMFYWGERVPAKWIELEQALVDRRNDGSNFIKMGELKDINRKLSAPLQSDDHLRLFLKVYHEMGTLINFNDSQSLRDIIILRPQWIIDAFRHLIRAKDFGEKYGQLRKQWEEFNDTGKLDVTLAESIWKQDHKNHFYENFNMLLEFLEKLDIIVRASQLLEDGTTKRVLDYYYVPCLLKEKPPENCLHLTQIPDGIRTPVLCFTFHERFLPPAVFNRIIALCLGRWPVARQGKRTFLFSGCAVFEIKERENEDRHRLHIFFKKSKIGLRISRYCTGKVKGADTVVCDRVRRFVAHAIRKEFRRFQNNQLDSSNTDRNPFYYQLQCPETKPSDILDDGLHDLKELDTFLTEVAKQPEHMIDNMPCTEHSDMSGPHLFDPRTLMKEWFPDKIPESLRESDETLLESWFHRLDRKKNTRLSENVLADLSSAFGKNWESLMFELGVQLYHIERSQIDNPRDVKTAIFENLKFWTFNLANPSPATVEMFLNALFKTKGVTIDWEQVQNIFDNLK